MILTSGEFALLNDSDEIVTAPYLWFRQNSGNTVYAWAKIDGTKTYLHRFLLQLSKGDGQHVDHINGNGLDNRRANLRVGTRSNNMQNSAKKTRATTPYKGVTWDKKRKNFLVQIHPNGTTINLGRFTDPVEGAKAYNEAARKFYGDFARLNKI